ncbi:KR domain-containing protein [Streptomyces sp. NPDC093510]|uniref:KR domain-containing protein n=1 Tax=Streptomyces sp. NPDC093510 TaxID=3155199 RepID=UPI0034423584
MNTTTTTTKTPTHGPAHPDPGPTHEPDLDAHPARELDLGARPAREPAPGPRPAREPDLAVRPTREPGLGPRPAREPDLSARPAHEPDPDPRPADHTPRWHTPVWAPAPARPRHPPVFTPDESLLVVDSRDTGRAWTPLGVRTARVGRDVLAGAHSWAAYLKTLRRAGHDPRVLVFDLPAATTTPQRAAELILPVLRALCGSTRRDPLHLAFLVTGRARPELAAALGAVAQAAAVEDGRLHALSLGVQHLPAWAGDPFRLALGELALPRPGLAEVRHTPAGREVRVLRAAPGPRPGAPTAAIRAGGRYLLTDTGTGTGARLALSLARRHRARIVLLTPDADPPLPGARIVRAAGRLSCYDDVHAALRTALHHFGGIDGVLHCADHDAGRPLSRLSAAHARQILADTLTGAAHLDRATAELPLDFFASATSTPAYRAGTGAAIPAAVGRALGALAAERTRLTGDGLRHGVSLATCLPARTDPLTALTQALAFGRSELAVHTQATR